MDTQLPPGYSLDGNDALGYTLLSDYTEDEVDAAVGVYDKETLIKLAWLDYNDMTPDERQARLAGEWEGD